MRNYAERIIWLSATIIFSPLIVLSLGIWYFVCFPTLWEFFLATIQYIFTGISITANYPRLYSYLLHCGTWESDHTVCPWKNRTTLVIERILWLGILERVIWFRSCFRSAQSVRHTGPGAIPNSAMRDSTLFLSIRRKAGDAVQNVMTHAHCIPKHLTSNVNRDVV